MLKLVLIALGIIFCLALVLGYAMAVVAGRADDAMEREFEKLRREREENGDGGNGAGNGDGNGSGTTGNGTRNLSGRKLVRLGGKNPQMKRASISRALARSGGNPVRVKVPVKPGRPQTQFVDCLYIGAGDEVVLQVHGLARSFRRPLSDVQALVLH